MAATTTIGWTDATWNPITGCSVLSAGCTLPAPALFDRVAA